MPVALAPPTFGIFSLSWTTRGRNDSLCVSWGVTTIMSCLYSRSVCIVCSSSFNGSRGCQGITTADISIYLWGFLFL